LAYEATEGGAGVLGRLTNDPRALARVARAALELMHFQHIDAAVAASDATLLETDDKADCVKACYRCLLSYYNQPDQEFIDRMDAAVLGVLLRLARSEVTPTTHPVADTESDTWLGAFKKWGLPAPHGESLTVESREIRFVWRDHRVAADVGEISDKIVAAADAIGFALVCLPAEPADAPPADLVELLGSAS
jgi:hypothetical protein